MIALNRSSDYHLLIENTFSFFPDILNQFVNHIIQKSKNIKFLDNWGFNWYWTSFIFKATFINRLF